MEEVVKKRPGRPKSKPAKTECNGIATQPKNVEDTVEMSYINPSIFKKLFKIIKEYEITEIKMAFNKTEIIFFMMTNVVKMQLTIYAQNLLHYYCKAPICIVVSSESVGKIFSSLDKKNHNVILLVREDQQTTTLHIEIRDFQYDCSEQCPINIIAKENYDEFSKNLNEIMPENQPQLSFVLDSKHFKKKIIDIQHTTNQFTIQKVDSAPTGQPEQAKVESIQFSFNDSKLAPYNIIYKSDEKIQLTSNIKPGSLFIVHVLVGHVKPFSQSAIGEKVEISATMGDSLKMVSMLDKGATTYTCKLDVRVVLGS